MTDRTDSFDSIEKPDTLLEDFDVLDHQDIVEFNAANILPQESSVLDGIRTWLNPTQYEGDGSEYQRHSSSHLTGTSQWALTSTVFQQWHDSQEHGILWVRGIPGSGKSVLASTFINHLLNNGPVLYFFFRHSTESNRHPQAAFRDWLSQALMLSPPLQLALTKEMSKPVNSITTGRMCELLRLALENIPKAFCVVDALDEMDHVALQPFLQLIDRLGNMRPKEVKFIITSRPIVHIEKRMRGLKVLDIRLDKALLEPDIIAYLWHKLGQSRLDPESYPEIVHSILKKAGGLFLYAKMAMDSILDVPSESHAMKALQRLPTKLTAIYDDLLKEHLQRTGLDLDLQILVLQLVTHANRPLRLLEISDCIKVAQPQYGDDSGKIKDMIRSICGPLLEVLPDETVCVVHHSLAEYLLGINMIHGEQRDFPLLKPGPTHNLMAILCLSYLSLGCLNLVKVKQASCDIISLESGQIYAPFTSYAGCNWFIHLNKAISIGHKSQDVIEALYNLLVRSNDENAMKLILLAKLGKTGRRSNGELLPPEVEALHLATELGLTELANIILERHGNGTLAYDGGRDNEPLLHHAVDKNNEDMVRLFLKHGANPNEHDSHGQLPLHIAVRLGHGGNEGTTKGSPRVACTLLKSGANPWKSMGKNKHVDYMGGLPSCPPISSVFTGSNEEMAASFLPFVKDTKDTAQAMHWAIHGDRNLKIMQMILGHCHANVNAKERRELAFFHMTPLYAACTMRDPKLIHILLLAGADPNIPHYEECSVGLSSPVLGFNALHALANPSSNPVNSSGRRDKIDNETIRECFKLVIEAGANVHQVDRDGTTPLHVSKDPVSVLCLLEAGADLDATDSKRHTLLDKTNDLAILDVLLPKLNVNDQLSISGERLLTRALAAKDENFAIKLLDHGADATIVDRGGNSTLHHAAVILGPDTMPNRNLLEKLMAGGANPNIRNSHGKTALEYAANSFRFNEKAFVVFLDTTKPDLEVRDSNSRTITFRLLDEWDSQRENYALSFVTIMAKRGARLDVTDCRGRTLLHVSIRICKNDGALLKFLVDKGVKPSQTDFEGNTIWHEGVRWFPFGLTKRQVFTDLTELGADSTQSNDRGVLPFHILCQFQRAIPDTSTRTEYTYAFDYLREIKPDVIDCTDSDGVTPLHIASTFSSLLTGTLLGLGADISAQTHEMRTVFHLAARSRQVDVLWLLVDWIKSNRKDQDLTEILDAKDVQGRSALYYACASGNHEVVELLLDSGATANTLTFIGSTWNGVTDFEDEQKTWIWKRPSGPSHFHDNAYYKPDAGGVLISDDFRPRPPNWESDAYPVEKIDKIVNILVARGSVSDSEFIEEGIVLALKRNCDHTAQCLKDARASLGSSTEAQVSMQSDSDVTFKKLQSVIPSLSRDMSEEKRDACIHSALLGVIDMGDTEVLQRMLSERMVDPNKRKQGKDVSDWTLVDGRRYNFGTHDPNCKEELYVLDYLACCDARRGNKHKVAVGTRMFNLLLDSGADLNSRYESTTVVHRTLEKGPVSGCQVTGQSPYLPLMLKHPSLDVEACDENGQTLFLRACALVNVPAAETLIERGASILARDTRDMNALHHLLSSRSFMAGDDQQDVQENGPLQHRDFLNRLIQLAPDLLHQTDKEGRTPLLCALGQGKYNDSLGPGIDVLVSGGANVAAANDQTGDTPLHLLFGGSWDIDATSGDDAAVLCGRRLELMDDFRTRGADVNARNQEGNTPIVHFIRIGTVQVKLPNNDEHKSVWDKDYWEWEVHQKKIGDQANVKFDGMVMELFGQVGVDWRTVNLKGQSLLHAVAAGEKDRTCHSGRKLGRFQYVMGKGLDILARDTEGRTPLDFAAATDAEDILEMIRRKQAHLPGSL